MATNPLQEQPQQNPSQEHTPSSPMQGTADDPQNSGGLTPDQQKKLIALVKRYKAMWMQDRIYIMQDCIENLEFFRGNQFFSFGPDNPGGFNAGGLLGGGGFSSTPHAQDADDSDLYMMCNNFYQMLAVGFVAALCPQVPKSKWMPEDAEELADVATAKVAQTIIDIVERDNKEQSQLKAQLLNLFTCGAVFRHTRYIVDADRNGTKPEPVYGVADAVITPDRMHCFQCGTDNEPHMQGCQNCQQPMSDDSFYPATNGPVVQQIGTKQSPKGAVVQDLYSPLEVDCKPRAKNLRQTPILNLEVEIDVAALRNAYPDMYQQIKPGAMSAVSDNSSVDRIYRQQVYSHSSMQQGEAGSETPTLSRTWIQPWAFDLEDDQQFGKDMRNLFPSGCLLVNTGETFLTATEADLNKEWTWCGTHEGFGLYPPAPGKTVVPFQKAYNDLASILRDGIDRTFSGLILANSDLVGSKALQGKQLLPGVLNPVKLTRTGAPGSMKLQDALWEFKPSLDIEGAMAYCKDQMMSAQMYAMVPPQVYGGQGDPSIETASGQKQQLGTAMGVLNIYWENLKDEHAAADQLAVKCAKDNLTEDLRKVIEEKGGFQNQYVRLDDLQGNVYAYPDEDQGLPVSASELRQRWSDLLMASEKNEAIQAIFQDPTNQEQAADALGVPGMVVPGAAMRSKTLSIIEKLLDTEPVPQVDPQTGQPTGMQPSIVPDPQIDDFDVAIKTIRQYCQERPDLPDDKPQGFQNLMAFLTATVSAQTAKQTQDASDAEVVKGKAALAGHMASMPPPQPPPPPPQLSPADQSMLNMVRKDGAQALQDLTEIAGTPKLGQGESLQAQVAAGNAVLQLASKVEQIAADKLSPQGQ